MNPSPIGQSAVTHCLHWLTSAFCCRLLSPDPPKVTIIGYDNNWYIGRTNVELTCQANGNPQPLTVKWKM